MNFALSDEQEFLKEAARGALVAHRRPSRRRARRSTAPRCPTCGRPRVEAGWPGLLVSEANGGAELAPLEAMLVFEELGRVLAGVPLLGHLPATFLLDRGGAADAAAALAAGEARAAFVPARPPATSTRAGRVEPAARARAARAAPALDARRTRDRHGRLGARTRPAPTIWSSCSTTAARRTCSPPTRASSRADVYDVTRSLGHVRARRRARDAARARPARRRGRLAHRAGADRRGGARGDRRRARGERRLRARSGTRSGARSAPTRRSSTSSSRSCAGSTTRRSLMYYAGWAAQDKPDEFALAAAAFRLAAGKALDHATRAQISVHGGIGATWEHDAPLYFRRAQLSRRLLGGDAGRRRPRGRRAARRRAARRPRPPSAARLTRTSGSSSERGSEAAADTSSRG